MQLFNQTITTIEPSLIRSIMETKHNGSYSRIHLGLGELPFSMPQKAQTANEQALKENKNLYTANAGLPQLRQVVAEEFSSQFNLALTEDNVIITIGATGALFIAFQTLLNPGDEVLIPALFYPIYKSIPQTLGATVITYDLQEDFSLDIDDLISKITTKTKCIVLNSPANPTGQIHTNDVLQKLAKATKKYPSLFFISDEIYSTYLADGKSHTSIAQFTDNVIVIDGLSKRASMTGKRLGWLIGPKDFIVQALKVQQYAYTCAPSDSQYAALAILSGICDDEIKQFQQTVLNNRQVMLDALADISGIAIHKPNGAFYCLIDISNFGTSVPVATKLIKDCNVVTVPGLAFGEAGDRYLRLSFAADKNEIEEGISRMKEVFKK